MKQFGFILIFSILFGVGFYFGSQTIIQNRDLLFSEVEERGPANTKSDLQQILESSVIKDESGILSIIRRDEDGNELSICNLIEGVEKYKTVSEAQGASVSGEPVAIGLIGDCSGNQKVFLFDRKEICSKSSELIRRGVVTSNFTYFGTNIFVPVDKFKFIFKSITVTYRDGHSEEIPSEGISSIPDSLATVFSCEEAVE